jgi:hypothetical protein
MEELPSAPIIAEASWPKIYKLARELKRRAALMTSGRDLHDIHTVLFLVAHWTSLQHLARNYTAHRLRLLYVVVTKGWPAAMFYDQQEADEFLDVPQNSGHHTSHLAPHRPNEDQPSPEVDLPHRGAEERGLRKGTSTPRMPHMVTRNKTQPG